jgi:hypothetical protein
MSANHAADHSAAARFSIWINIRDVLKLSSEFVSDEKPEKGRGR